MWFTWRSQTLYRCKNLSKLVTYYLFLYFPEFPSLRFVTGDRSGSSDESVSLDFFEENGEWKLIDAHLTIDETNGYFDLGNTQIAFQHEIS